MLKFLPSDVVKMIDDLFPSAKAQDVSNGGDFYIDKNHASKCSAIIDAIEKIHDELLDISDQDKTEYLTSINAIKHALEQWKNNNYKLNALPNFKNRSPVTSIRHILTKCPNNPIVLKPSEHFEKPLVANFLQILKKLWSKHWKWIVTTIIALIALIIQL